jgi:hypothetical protein
MTLGSHQKTIGASQVHLTPGTARSRPLAAALVNRRTIQTSPASVARAAHMRHKTCLNRVGSTYMRRRLSEGDPNETLETVPGYGRLEYQQIADHKVALWTRPVDDF